MMRGFAVVLLTALVLQPLVSQAAPDLPELLEDRIPHLMGVYDIPGVSVALVSGGELVWSQGFGWADVEAQRPMTADTRCRVQSISKPVTAWGILHLADRGRIDLDNPASKYITSWASDDPQWSAVTVRELLTHGSGLPIGDVMDQYAPEDDVPSVRESLSREAHWKQRPRGVFSYSNPGFNLLEVLIEDVTGLRFSQYMHDTVLVPLGMAAASFDWSADFDPPVPTGYNTKKDPVPVYVYPGRASGGLFASAEDVAHFLIAGMQTNPVLDEDLVRSMYEPAIPVAGIYSRISPHYGLGYFVETLEPGVRAVWHGGQGNGLMTHFHSVPANGDALVILTNSQRSWPFVGDILRLWAEAIGVEPPGMSAIFRWERLLQAFSVLLVLLSMGTVLYLDKRKHSRQRAGLRAGLQLVLGIGLIGLVVWARSQTYLFLTSVFPLGAEWLGWALAAVGVICVAASLRLISRMRSVAVLGG